MRALILALVTACGSVVAPLPDAAPMPDSDATIHPNLPACVDTCQAWACGEDHVYHCAPSGEACTPPRTDPPCH